MRVDSCRVFLQPNDSLQTITAGVQRYQPPNALANMLLAQIFLWLGKLYQPEPFNCL
jgi:hypothetical protein